MIDKIRLALEGATPSGASILKNLLEAIKKAETDIKRPLNENEIIEIVKKVKVIFSNSEEIHILNQFLPLPPDLEEIGQKIDKIIENSEKLSLLMVPEITSQLFSKENNIDSNKIATMVYEKILQNI